MPRSNRVLPLGFKATQQVRKMADEHPEMNLKDLAAFTGYDVYAIAEALKGAARFAYIRKHWLKPGPPPPLVNGKVTSPDDLNVPGDGTKAKYTPKKPQFVKEIEQHTGLKCKYRGRHKEFSEWVLMSPNRVPLFTLYGRSNILVGCMPPKPSHIQGLPSKEMMDRKRRKKSLEPDGEVKADEELDSEPD